MELILLAGSWWLIGFSGAMMPGPVTTLVVAESAKRGFIGGPLVTLGHALLELAMVVALFFGFGDLLKQNVVAGTIGVVGGLVLLWMGVGLVHSAWKGQVSFCTATSERPTQSSGNPILNGVLMSISNPYWWLWWATVGVTYLVTFRAFGLPGIIAFYVGHTLADWTWNSLVAFVVSTGRRVMNDQVYRSILIVCGAFLVVLSIYFVQSGIGFFSG